MISIKGQILRELIEKGECSKPKPCPFCGSENLDMLSKWKCRNVVCESCLAQGPEAPRFDNALAVRLWDNREKDGTDD